VSVATIPAPFLAFDSFRPPADAEAPEPSVGYGIAERAATRSPFVSVYEAGDDESAFDDPMREACAGLIDELHDEEFDEALFELECHARALHDRQLAAGVPRSQADRTVMQHFSPLVRECEAVVDAMAQQFGPRESGGLVEGEIDAFVDRYAPATGYEMQQDPQFEQFFGKLLKKVGGVVKKVAGKALQGIKKLALGPLLSRLKALIKPLLQRVLQKAIGHLPAPVQPIALQLARKLGFAPPEPAPAPAPAPTDAGTADADLAAAGVQDVAGADAPLPQQEFDLQVANAVLAQDETQLDMEVAQSIALGQGDAQPVFAELDDARERLVQELQDLRPGESPQPMLENFIPALLPVLNVGIRLIGRPRVVNFLASLLAKLIANLVGPQQASMLSRAIVDSGLKLLNLETTDGMTPEQEAGLAASAVAATVEEAVGRIAALPDHVLDQPELLEGYAMEAFEQAAAANLPAVLPPGTYRQRPELLEAGIDAGWVMLPLRGCKRYKRCTRVFDVRITPHMASEVASFEGAPLADFLHEQLGLPEGEPADAQVHLYEALPGTSLADIARNEFEQGDASGALGSQELHPLTPQAAATLLGAPGLGRAADGSGSRPAMGQRFYRVDVGGRRPHLHRRHGLAQARARRPMRLTLRFDCTRDQIRAGVFLSEAKAQKLAMRLRQSTNAGVLSAGFGRALQGRLRHLLSGPPGRGLRVVNAGTSPAAKASLQNLPQAQARRYAGALQNWLVQGFASFIQSQSAAFIAATENAADGVTLRFAIAHPPSLKAVCDAMGGRGAAPAELALEPPPAVTVSVAPGQRHG
jgi:hypothetical protein